jgi:hypothetical protein
MHFPNGIRDTKLWEQASRQAKWLAKYLSAATGRNVQARAAVSLPGWFVIAKCPNPEMIYPPALIVSQIKAMPKVLEEEEIEATLHQIEQKVRDVVI